MIVECLERVMPNSVELVSAAAAFAAAVDVVVAVTELVPAAVVASE